MRPGRTRFRIMIALLIVVGGLAGSTTAWADDHIQGVIIGRTEGGVVVQTDSARLTIGLSDTTRIHRTDGIRLVPVGSADLIPGLHRGRTDASSLRQIVLIALGIATMVWFS